MTVDMMIVVDKRSGQPRIDPCRVEISGSGRIWFSGFGQIQPSLSVDYIGMFPDGLPEWTTKPEPSDSGNESFDGRSVDELADDRTSAAPQKRKAPRPSVVGNVQKRSKLGETSGSASAVTIASTRPGPIKSPFRPFASLSQPPPRISHSTKPPSSHPSTLSSHLAARNKLSSRNTGNASAGPSKAPYAASQPISSTSTMARSRHGPIQVARKSTGGAGHSMARTRPVKRTRVERERQNIVSSSSSSSLPEPGSSQFTQKVKQPPPAQAEIINISDDSDDEPVTKTKPALKPKAKVRKVSPANSIVEISSDSGQGRRPKFQPMPKERRKSPIEIIDVDALDDGEVNPPLPLHTDESDESSNRGGIPDDPIILDEPLFLDDPDEPLDDEPLIMSPSGPPVELAVSLDIGNEDYEVGPQANSSATPIRKQVDPVQGASGALLELNSMAPAPSVSAPPLPLPPLPRKARPSHQSTTLPLISRAQTPEERNPIAVKGSLTTPSLPKKHRLHTDQISSLSVKASPSTPRKSSQLFFEDHSHSRLAGNRADKSRCSPALSSPNKGMQSLADAIVQAHANNNVRSPPKPIPLPRKTKSMAGKARTTDHPSARAEGGRLMNALKWLQAKSAPETVSSPKSPIQVVARSFDLFESCGERYGSGQLVG
ncbi:uncharacterized protein BT62DRAFT_580190 [Guyanagaster necrorhizus]|uniref:Uncharacterized protein n=1 Tax=Guyanagaster necrorhizus TaxID=856835 RepID=A0A9P7VH80_9AGAR|nr:uncharacterized protein BT62DRAFT_580190 [Guyanagaster necrorhizus MCA 3950]KAG7440537.1 hypothetical protein BT62DRAFT_580190 [Guyanagaster necrorhizus MCA 3950]